MEVVESATLTIRLAQRYRAQIRHEDWEDEKKLRRDAFEVLSILRGIAERAGRDVGEEEKLVVRKWCKDVRARIERDDEVRRQMWERAVSWMDGEWEGKEWGNPRPTLTIILTLERYHLLLSQFDTSEPPLPAPTTDSFLHTLRTGTKLCIIHNAITHFSLRPFGLITRFHTDTSVRYRVTDNLRYFAKAAQIRWDIQLDWDVEEIWHATPLGDEMLQRELGKWCEFIINEMTKLYREEVNEGGQVLDELLAELGG